MASLRKLLLTIHIATSVGWLGAIFAYLPLDLATELSQDTSTVRAAYIGMELIAGWIIVPLALVAFGTGVLVSVTTPWGLFRHYWVLLSLILTAVAVAVLLVEMRTIRGLGAIARDAATTSDALLGLPSTLPHSIGGAIVLLAVLVLNVYKPRGLTRYGWRKQREEPARLE